MELRLPDVDVRVGMGGKCIVWVENPRDFPGAGDRRIRSYMRSYLKTIFKRSGERSGMYEALAESFVLQRTTRCLPLSTPEDTKILKRRW